jgi:hypothetical protein
MYLHAEDLSELLTWECSTETEDTIEPHSKPLRPCLGRGPLQAHGVSKTLMSASQPKLNVRQDIRVSKTCVCVSKT